VSARSYRIAPRPRARGRPKSRVKWDKLGRVVLVCVLFVVVALYVRPIMNFVDAWRTSKAEQATRSELAAQYHQLRRRSASLEQPDAIERAARRMGMVMSGEQPFAVTGLRK